LRRNYSRGACATWCSSRRPRHLDVLASRRSEPSSLELQARGVVLCGGGLPIRPGYLKTHDRGGQEEQACQRCQGLRERSRNPRACEQRDRDKPREHDNADHRRRPETCCGFAHDPAPTLSGAVPRWGELPYLAPRPGGARIARARGRLARPVSRCGSASARAGPAVGSVQRFENPAHVKRPVGNAHAEA